MLTFVDVKFISIVHIYRQVQEIKVCSYEACVVS